jgi:hypothetical protein
MCWLILTAARKTVVQNTRSEKKFKKVKKKFKKLDFQKMFKKLD